MAATRASRGNFSARERDRSGCDVTIAWAQQLARSSGFDPEIAIAGRVAETLDLLGLAEIYQLRGRVGRSTRSAYAYFTVRPDKALSETAEKRLSAIKEFTEFGSGFRIALRDLSIRGAGNMLGPEQSGQVSAVGYDLYCKMIEEAVREAKGDYSGDTLPLLQTEIAGESASVEDSSEPAAAEVHVGHLKNASLQGEAEPFPGVGQSG